MSQQNESRPDLRASDADRDRVAEVLREALAEGRLTPDEHAERLDIVYGSKTMGELVPLTADLPEAGTVPLRPEPQAFHSPRPIYGRERVGGTAKGKVAIAVMGGATRGGDWVVPPSFTAFAMMGGVEIDLREARFEEQETTINASALMGGVTVIVPDDIEVHVNGFGFMGGYGKQGASSSVTEPGTPIVTVRGIAVMGGVGVIRRPRKHQRRRREPNRGREQRELED